MYEAVDHVTAAFDGLAPWRLRTMASASPAAASLLTFRSHPYKWAAISIHGPLQNARVKGKHAYIVRGKKN